MPLKPATILILTSCYPKEMGEPSGIFLHHLAKHLRFQGWRVLVLAPNFPGGKIVDEIEGIPVRRFNYFIPRWQNLCYVSGMLPNLKKSPWLWFQAPFYLASLFWEVMKLLRTDSVDLIHAHWILPQGLVTRLIGSVTQKPFILTVHGGDICAFKGPVGSFFKRFALGTAGACTANSTFTQSRVQAVSDRVPIRLVPMGVDVDGFSPGAFDPGLRKRLGIEAEMILFVGRLVEKKGVYYLLRAMPEVLKVFPEAVLVLIGDGAQRAALEQLASRSGIGGSVRFLGAVSHDKLPPYYAAADVFVGPSVVDREGDTEGLGIVFLEAASSRVPIIGTSVGGIGDVLREGVTGLAVEPGEVTGLAQAIKRLLGDKPLRDRLGKGAREHVLEYFSWCRVAESFGALFREVLEEKVSSAGTPIAMTNARSRPTLTDGQSKPAEKGRA